MLDENLYTLNCVQSANKPEEVHLIEEGTGTHVYVRTKSEQDDGLQVDIFDHQSLAPLVSVHTQTFKHRVITLHNPPYSVDLDSTGRIHWEFTFIWEGEWKVYWRRDTVGMSGKSKGYTAYLPDPDVNIAAYHPSEAGGYIQFFDYNLQRFSFADRRGLELALLAGLFSFVEQTDDPPNATAVASSSRVPSTSPQPPVALASRSSTEPNEIVVDSRPMADALVRATHLLDDPLMLYVFFRAKDDPDAVKKAVKAAEAVKRQRAKERGEELMQYVVDDDPEAGRSTPPKSIRIFLSRTPLDELLPSAARPALPARQPVPGPAVPAKQPKPPSPGGGGFEGWKRKLFSPVVSRDREV